MSCRRCVLFLALVAVSVGAQQANSMYKVYKPHVGDREAREQHTIRYVQHNDVNTEGQVPSPHFDLQNPAVSVHSHNFATATIQQEYDANFVYHHRSQSPSLLLHYSRASGRCFSCATVDPVHIVGGAGVHPGATSLFFGLSQSFGSTGVYLSTIDLKNIPVTPRCYDPFFGRSAMLAGALVPTCDDGICVKINYTERVSGAHDVLRVCLPQSRGVFKPQCIRFSSGAGEGHWCACDSHLCNGAAGYAPALGGLLILLLLHAIL